MTPLSPTNEPSANERREFHRRAFRAAIEIDWGSTILSGTVRDIGPQGLFIELTPPLWVGATFTARLLLDPALRLDCTVRRVEPEGGIAVRFDVSDESGKRQLENLLATLPRL
jgi:hypothetical protein